MTCEVCGRRRRKGGAAPDDEGDEVAMPTMPKVTIPITVAAEMSVSDIVHNSGATHEDLFDLIAAIDFEVGEWDFTLRLAEHFARLRAEQEAESIDDEARALARGVCARCGT